VNLGAVIPDEWLPATLTVPGLTEAEFFSICEQYPISSVEYTADGTLIILPPGEPECSARVLEAATQLCGWAKERGRGHVVGPDVGFRLPNGSRRSPDAAWFDSVRWAEAKKSGELFPLFAPEFVIEVRPPDVPLFLVEAKMEEYIANGVKLGWLIDPKLQTVTIYRAGRNLEVLSKPATVIGEGPVAGFELSLDGIL
jgi:Uma2 family endonuclease